MVLHPEYRKGEEDEDPCKGLTYRMHEIHNNNNNNIFTEFTITNISSFTRILVSSCQPPPCSSPPPDPPSATVSSSAAPLPVLIVTPEIQEFCKSLMIPCGTMHEVSFCV